MVFWLSTTAAPFLVVGFFFSAISFLLSEALGLPSVGVSLTNPAIYRRNPTMGIKKELFSNPDQKNIGCSMPLTLTIGAEPEKIQTMTGDLKSCFRNEFPGHALEALQIRVNNLFAFSADEMRMRVRSVAVIAIAPLRKPNFQHLVQFFEKGHGFVNRGQACRRKTPFHLFEDMLNSWVPVTGGQDLEHSHTLRRDSRIVPPERFEHCVVTGFLTGHALWINGARIIKNNFQKRIDILFSPVNKKSC